MFCLFYAKNGIVFDLTPTFSIELKSASSPQPGGLWGGLCESDAAIEKGGALPLGRCPAAFALQNKNKKTTASIEAVVYGGELGTRTPDPLRVMQVL